MFGIICISGGYQDLPPGFYQLFDLIYPGMCQEKPTRNLLAEHACMNPYKSSKTALNNGKHYSVKRIKTYNSPNNKTTTSSLLLGLFGDDWGRLTCLGGVGGGFGGITELDWKAFIRTTTSINKDM